MTFVARYGFVVLLALSIIITGMLVLDATLPLVNELHQALSPTSQPTSPLSAPTIA